MIPSFVRAISSLTMPDYDKETSFIQAKFYNIYFMAIRLWRKVGQIGTKMYKSSRQKILKSDLLSPGFVQVWANPIHFGNNSDTSVYSTSHTGC